jgi:hypothetical protein
MVPPFFIICNQPADNRKTRELLAYTAAAAAEDELNDDFKNIALIYGLNIMGLYDVVNSDAPGEREENS